MKKMLSADGVVLFILRRIFFRGFGRFFSLISTSLHKISLKSVGKGFFIKFGSEIESPKNVELGSDVVIASGVEISSENGLGSLILGNNVKINKNVKLDYTGGVIVGDNVVISEGSIIYSHQHKPTPFSSPTPLSKKIGNNVWICSGVLLLEGCRSVGDNSIIAAGSVVTKDVPSNSVVGGNPAKILKRIN